MHQVMSSHEAKQKAGAFGTTFAVEPRPLELDRGELAEKMDVG
jgi:hypothetical protein